MEKRWQNRTAQVSAYEIIAKSGGVALAVTFGALPVSGEPVVRLLDAGNNAGAHEAKGIEGLMKEVASSSAQRSC